MKTAKRFVVLGLFSFMIAGFAEAGVIAYSNDFDGNLITASGVTGTISGLGTQTGVQGYSGLGTGSNVFSGNFLINGSLGATTLTLSGLPDHTSVDINFLLAIIDSWDGIGPFGFQPDFFNVSVDGLTIFSKSFLNSVVSPGFQNYAPPTGVELANDVNLGFSHHSLFNTTVEHWRDDAYNMGLDPIFDNIAHTGSTLTLDFFASGDGFQGGTDESWAIENLEIVLNGTTASVSEPATPLILLAGIVGLVSLRRYKGDTNSLIA